MWILCLAEDSHEISSLIFSLKKKNEKVFMNGVMGALRVNSFRLQILKNTKFKLYHIQNSKTRGQTM